MCIRQVYIVVWTPVNIGEHCVQFLSFLATISQKDSQINANSIQGQTKCLV